MRISKARVLNFRNLENVRADLGKINVIGGLNNSGKTSFLRALRAGLIGGGRNAKLDIRTGASAGARIDIAVDGFGVITRVIDSKGQAAALDGRKMPQNRVEEEFEKQTGINTRALECLLDTGYFASLKASEQKDFLIQLMLSTSLNKATVLALMSYPSPEAAALAESELPDTITLESLDEFYKYVFAERRLAKKQLAETVAQLQGLGKLPEQTPSYSSEEHRKACEERDVLLKELGQIDAIEKQKANTQAKLEAVTKKVQSLSGVSGDEKHYDAKIAEAQKGLEAIRAKKQKVQVAIGSINAEIRTAKNIYSKVQNTSTCPLTDKLTCTVDKTPLLNELITQIKTGEEALKKHQAELDALTEKERTLTTEIRESEQKRKQAVELAHATKAQEELAKELAAIVVPDKTKIKERLDNLLVAIKGFEEAKQALQLYKQERKRQDTLSESVNKLGKRVEILEYLVKEFSPSGIKERILRQAIGPVEARCNEVLGKLTSGYTLAFNFSSRDLDITVNTGSGKVLLEGLSASERWRVGIVLQDAISTLVGARFLFVDEVDMLDDENKDRLIDLLHVLAENYDFIVLALTVNDPAELRRFQGLEDTLCFHMENGKLSAA